MKRAVFCILVVSLAGSLSFAWQGPGEKQDKKKDKGFEKKGMMPGFELGRVLPPPLVETLDLTDEQKKQIEDLEKEVKSKLMKILTKEQQKQATNFRGKGGPPGGKEGEKDKGKGKDKKGIPERPPEG